MKARHALLVALAAAVTVTSAGAAAPTGKVRVAIEGRGVADGSLLGRFVFTPVPVGKLKQDSGTEQSDGRKTRSHTRDGQTVTVNTGSRLRRASLGHSCTARSSISWTPATESVSARARGSSCAGPVSTKGLREADGRAKSISTGATGRGASAVKVFSLFRRAAIRHDGGELLPAWHLVLAAAVLTLLAGSSYAQGAPSAKDFLLSPSAIQINPKRPNIVYASTLGDDTHEGGVIKSTDAGKTWSLADTGLSNPASPTDSEDLRVDALALDPRSPNVLYAGTGLGVFKTTDGAKTWKLASTGIDFGGDPLGHRMLEGFIWAIAIDPRHTQTLYAAGNGVWKSTNAGATWKRVLRNSAVSLGIDPSQPEIVYASGMKSFQNKATRNSVYKTVDGGSSWRATGPSALHDGGFARPIVVDRRAPGMIYAGGSRGLFASANQGRTWKKLLSREVTAIALDSSRANVLHVGTNRGIVKSVDGGKTWSAPRLAGRYVNAIAIARTRPQTIYAGGDRVWKSRDGGATWQRLS